jgi:antitoxin component of MazEF toxin-antitoxin module
MEIKKKSSSTLILLPCQRVKQKGLWNDSSIFLKKEGRGILISRHKRKYKTVLSASSERVERFQSVYTKIEQQGGGATNAETKRHLHIINPLCEGKKKLPLNQSRVFVSIKLLVSL